MVDEIALLRSIRDEVEPPRPAAITAGRAALMGRIASEQATATVRRRRRRSRLPVVTRRGAVAFAGALVAVGGLTTVLIAAPPTASSADAAEVLQRASQWASMSAIAAPGTVTEYRSTDVLDEEKVAVDRSWTTLLKVPNGDGRWVRKKTFTSFRYAYGDRFAFTEEPSDLRPHFETATDGVFAFGSAPAATELGASPARIRDLPRDPDGLLKAFRDDAGAQGSGTAWATLSSAEVVLTSGVADQSLQAAVFAALQRVPDLVVLDEHAEDLYGRAGVAIGVRPGTPDPTGSYNSTRLIIDPSTGRFLGVDAIALHASGPVPTGADLGATAIRSVEYDPADWAVTGGASVSNYP